jgi:shikimate kinase/3-dehydroquinate synthase
VVKTGLLLGEPLEISLGEQVRRCAPSRPRVHARSARAGNGSAQPRYTFAHALEAAAGYALPHGEAVALGLIAALRLSGLEDEAEQVDALLAPARPRVDRDRAWDALRRDKKAAGGRVQLVLLTKPGMPVTGAELPDADVRAALDALIA